MPTYQYRCTECGHDLEAVQKFTDVALTECPHCGGSLRKIYNAVGVVFKGSGFYRTDNRTTPSEAGSDASPSEGIKSTGEKATPAKESGDGGSKTPAKEPAPAASSSSPSSSSSSSGSRSSNSSSSSTGSKASGS